MTLTILKKTIKPGIVNQFSLLRKEAFTSGGLTSQTLEYF